MFHEHYMDITTLPQKTWRVVLKESVPREALPKGFSLPDVIDAVDEAKK